MAAVDIPRLDISEAISDPQGRPTRIFWEAWNALVNRTGGRSDKVDTAHTLASNAVPQGTEVVASGGLKNGGALGGNVGLTLYVAIDALANLPTTGLSEGDMAYALDGLKSGETTGAGTGTPAWWSNSGPGWFAVWSGVGVVK